MWIIYFFSIFLFFLLCFCLVQNPESQYSPAQNAVVLVFTRAVEAGIEKGVDSGVRGSPVTARLVIPSNQVGCVMGKGGTIVSEIRKATGAGIRILGNDQVPKCASDNDSVVQVRCCLVYIKHVKGKGFALI